MSAYLVDNDESNGEKNNTHSTEVVVTTARINFNEDALGDILSCSLLFDKNHKIN